MSEFIRLTAADFAPTEPTIPDAVLDESDPYYNASKPFASNRITKTETDSINIDANLASDKARYQKENNIQPGTPEWFKLWFAKTGLTNESPW